MPPSLNLSTSTLFISPRYLELHPNAPYALSMLLAHGGSGVLPPLADLSLDIFDALDGYDQERTTAYVLILREYVANADMGVASLRAGF